MEPNKLRSSIEGLDSVLSPFRELASFRENTTSWNIEVIENVLTSMSKSLDSVPSVLELAYAVPHQNIFVNPSHQASILSSTIASDDASFISEETAFFKAELLRAFSHLSDDQFAQAVNEYMKGATYSKQIKELLQVKSNSDQTD